MAEVMIRSFNAVRAEMFGRKLTVQDKIILSHSCPHTHTELQFSSRYGNISHSSTKADGANGPRFKQIDYSHPERWDTVDVPATDEQEDIMYKKAVELNESGAKYDLIGLLTFATSLDIVQPDRKNIWCTEDVNMLLIAGLPEWFEFLKSLILKYTVELTPCQLDMLARHYWKQEESEILTWS
jgi:hypothetical protein